MIETLLAFLEEHRSLLGIIAGVSVLMFIASILSLPYLVSLIPDDYFQRPEPYHLHHKFKHPLIRLLVITVKNLIGWLLVITGILMLVLPGQGLITLALGLILIDFPGKRSLECRVVSNEKVLHTINWLRLKRNKTPLKTPD